MRRLILASESKNRAQALRIARIPFEAVPADIDEKSISGSDVRNRVENIALAKVNEVAKSQAGLILGLDGVNLCRDKVLEKPKDLNEAKEMIRLQSGETSSFLTGYCLMNTETGNVFKGVTESRYRFRAVEDSEIDEYVKCEPVLSWAAAFSPLNSSAIRFVEWMEGSPSQFAFSMPLDVLMPLFKREGLV